MLLQIVDINLSIGQKMIILFLHLSNYSFPVERNRELVAHFDFSTDLEKLG